MCVTSEEYEIVENSTEEEVEIHVTFDILLPFFVLHIIFFAVPKSGEYEAVKRFV